MQTPSCDAPDDGYLAGLLKEAGVMRTSDEVRALIEGVLAAPPGRDADAWLVLIGQDLPVKLVEHLRALRTERANRHPSSPNHAARLTQLRDALKNQGLDGFVVPRGDEHQGEYVPPRAERLAWLTGFTGSAGQAVIAARHAAVFVDGRYTLQARQQVAEGLYDHKHLTDDPLPDWVASVLPAGSKLGYDPWLHTISWVEKTRGALERAGVALVPTAVNPIDSVWADQPLPPLAPVVAHDLAFAGVTAADKRASIAGELMRDGVGAAVLTQPDAIAWLLNIRGGDVPCAPLPLCFAILADDGGVDLFIDQRKLTPGVEAHLGKDVTVRPLAMMGEALDALGRRGRKVLIDPTTTAAWIVDRLVAAKARILRDTDPCALPRACKNPVELDGARRAHRRDGVAMVRFLKWLSETAPSGAVTELGAVERLLDIRAQGEHFRGTSFETISGAGPNGAVVHYRVSPKTDRRLEMGSLYLIDSGAQYLDGTTDVTRTIAIGAPTDEMRTRFTQVLKGHIALSSARFPRGTTGSQLDTLARLPLWMAGVDYDHGTGHGVGSYLSVHEGPQRISKLPNPTPLQPGMILSNEPGYYKPGAYGIRIENLIVVRPSTAVAQPERVMLDFEVLTLVPIDRTLVMPQLLSVGELDWLDSYHAVVQKTLSPLLDADTVAWLTSATEPMPR